MTTQTNAAVAATLTATVNFGKFTSAVDFKNAEHFRRGSSIRLERDEINERLLIHVFQVGTLILVKGDMSMENQRLAWFHAFGQRIPDAAALSERERAGYKATPQEKFNAMKPLVEHYNSGSPDWNIERESTGNDTVLVEALMREKASRSRVDVQKYVAELPKGKRDLMLNSERLRKIVSEIRKERNANVNEAELFADLDK